MGIYETKYLGYVVTETIDGLDVYEDEEMIGFVCELSGKCFNDYRYDCEIDDDKLEADIKEAIEIKKFLNFH